MCVSDWYDSEVQKPQISPRKRMKDPLRLELRTEVSKTSVLTDYTTGPKSAADRIRTCEYNCTVVLEATTLTARSLLLDWERNGRLRHIKSCNGRSGSHAARGQFLKFGNVPRVRVRRNPELIVNRRACLIE